MVTCSSILINHRELKNIGIAVVQPPNTMVYSEKNLSKPYRFAYISVLHHSSHIFINYSFAFHFILQCSPHDIVTVHTDLINNAYNVSTVQIPQFCIVVRYSWYHTVYYRSDRYPCDTKIIVHDLESILYKKGWRWCC